MSDKPMSTPCAGRGSKDLNSTNAEPCYCVKCYDLPPRPATGDGELDKLITKYGERVCTMGNAWRLTSEAAMETRASIHSYVSAAVQEAVKVEREACIGIANMLASQRAEVCEASQARQLRFAADKMRARSDVPPGTVIVEQGGKELGRIVNVTVPTRGETPHE